MDMRYATILLCLHQQLKFVGLIEDFDFSF